MELNELVNRLEDYSAMPRVTICTEIVKNGVRIQIEHDIKDIALAKDRVIIIGSGFDDGEKDKPIATLHQPDELKK